MSTGGSPKGSARMALHTTFLLVVRMRADPLETPPGARFASTARLAGFAVLVPNNTEACGATGIAVADDVLSDAPDAENTSTPIVTGHVGVGASEEGRNRAIVDHARDGEERRERRRSVRGLGHREGEYGSSCDHCAQHGLILLHDFRSWGAPVRAPWSHRSAPSPLGLGESAGPRDVPSVLRAACFRILAQRRYKSCSNARRSTPTTSVPGRSGDGRTARRYAPRW